MLVEYLFFELVQVALGKQEKLSRTPSTEEWHKLYMMCQQQAVIGVTFPALDNLSKEGQKVPVPLLYDWIGASEQIRQRNNLLNNRCKEIQDNLLSKGINSSILKGQGIAKYYKADLMNLRQPGDIDVFVDCGREVAIKFVKQYGEKIIDWDYRHVKLSKLRDVEVELHYRVEGIPNLIKNRRLQKWFKANETLMFEQCEGLVTPSLQFNIFYILFHIYRHFLHEGIGLRQLMDYYFVLVKAGGNFGTYANDESIKDVLRNFGMLKFTAGLMWVMSEVFKIDKNLMVCTPSKKEGKFILEVIMTGGNFGHSDGRINGYTGKLGYVKKVIKHDLHIFSHYPSELLWSPIWMVYHKCWKLTKRYKTTGV